MRKIGIDLPWESHWTDEEYIRAAAEAGFGAMFTGMLEEERQLRCADLMARAGIEYETIHAPFSGINAIWLDNADGEAMLKRLTDCVDRCVQIGAPIAVVHLSAGNNPPPITDIGRSRFARLVEHASSKGVKIAFENQRKLANLAWAMETFSSEDSAGFCWDCGHESCFTPGREYMPLFGSRLICTHVHDNMGVYNQDDHLLPFDGKIDYSCVAAHIRKSGYQGSLMLEIKINGNDKCYANLPVEEYLRRAAASVSRLAAMIDCADSAAY